MLSQEGCFNQTCGTLFDCCSWHFCDYTGICRRWSVWNYIANNLEKIHQ